MFSTESRTDKDVRQAIQYLREWGESFWVETEYRVKEITKTMEDKLQNQIGSDIRAMVLKGGVSSVTDSRLSVEEKGELITRGQRVVSETQVRDIGRVRDLLDGVLTNRQKNYYILIDRLDENWVEEKLRYRLIMALLDSIKEIGQLNNIKILVAIRLDLISRVFRFSRGDGFQEEKYHSLYLPIQWSPSQIMELLDKRIGNLVARRYQKRNEVAHQDVLPNMINNVPIMQFITDRAVRPRDVISFFNKCIEVAEGQPRLTVSTLRNAEGQYSRQRLEALADEWHADYPGLIDFVNILKGRPRSFRLGQVRHEDVTELCLRSAINHPDESGMLRAPARNVAEGLGDVSDFKLTLFMAFYRAGLVGLKLESFEKASWIGESGQGVSRSEMDDQTGVTVHATYQRALGIREKEY